MKKVLKIIIITVIVVLNMNVNAEAAWPKTITNQDIIIPIKHKKYNKISKFIFKLNKNGIIEG